MAAARSRPSVLAAVAAGGVIGATARFLVVEAIPSPDNGFPVSTLVVNVVGSFLLGFVTVAAAGAFSRTRYLGPFVTVGVIGSFTTFSAFAAENILLVDGNDLVVAMLYIPVMLLAGVGAARLGVGAARRVDRSAVPR